MNNLWKRSLSLVLALVMIVGMFPMGIKAKAANADSPLSDASGIVWLSRKLNADGTVSESPADELEDLVMDALFDNVIRRALKLGEADDTIKVYYDGLNVGSRLELAKAKLEAENGGDDKIAALTSQMSDAVKYNKLVPMDVDVNKNGKIDSGERFWVAFVNIYGSSVEVGENGQIIVEHEGEPSPSELKEMVDAALANPTFAIKNSDGVSAKLDQTRYQKTSSAAAGYSWPTAEQNEEGVPAGTVTITVYADEIAAGTHKPHQMKSGSATIILKDTRAVHTVSYKIRFMKDDVCVEEREIASHKVYHGDPMPVCNYSNKYYTSSGWGEVAATVTEDVVYTMDLVAKNDGANNDGYADEEQKFTVTYLVNGAPYEKFENVPYGIETPQAAKPGAEYAPAGKHFNGWKAVGGGNVAMTVTKDATYEATWIEGPSVTAYLRYRGTERVQNQVYLFTNDADSVPEDQKKYYVSNPGFETYYEGTGYQCTGWYQLVPVGTPGAQDLNYDGVAQEKPWNFSNEVKGELVLYFELYIKPENEEFAEGTSKNPVYIYQFLDGNGETLEKKELGHEILSEEVPVYPDLENDSVVFEKWNYGTPVCSNPNPTNPDEFGVYTYTVIPELQDDLNNNGKADSTEMHVVSMAGELANLAVTRKYENGKIILTFGNPETDAEWYRGEIYVSGLIAVNGGTEGRFTYKPNQTVVKASPLWLKGDPSTGKMKWYVEDIDLFYVDDLGESTNLEIAAPAYSDNYLATMATPEMVPFAAAAHYDIKVNYARSELKISRDDLVAGQAYEEIDAYNAATGTGSPTFGDSIDVQYQARKAAAVTVDLKVLFDYLSDLIPDDYLNTVKEYIPETITVNLTEEWRTVGTAVPAAKSAQMAADEKIISFITEWEAKGYDLEYMIDQIFVLEGDIADKVQAEANFHQFANGDKKYRFGEDMYHEHLKLINQSEKFYYSQEAYLYTIDNRIPVVLENKGDQTLGYRCFTDAKLLQDYVVIKNAVTGEIIDDLDLFRSYQYLRAGRSEIVTVSYPGNAKYSMAETEFKLTISKVKPQISVPHTVFHALNGVIEYKDVAAKVTPASAPYIQVVAGVEAEELKFDSNLVIKDDDIVVKAWVKMPEVYIALLNALDMGVPTGEFVNALELKSQLEEYAANPANKGAKEIKQILAIVDEIPERLINRLGLADRTYPLMVRLDSFEDTSYPTKPGMYVNFAASTAYLSEYLPGDYGSLFKNDNYEVSYDIPTGTGDLGKIKNLAADGGIIVISPMVPVPNSNGIQIYDANTNKAENLFVYEYNGSPVDINLDVSYNGEKLEGAEPFYYGVSTRMDLKNSAPTMPGVYVAGYNHFTTVYNETTKEEEIRRLGSDSCVIIIKQREADLGIQGGIYEYDGTNKFPTIITTDKNGNVITDAGTLVVSGTVNVNKGTNVTANDLYGAINVDFPDGLTIPALELGENAVFTRLEDAWNYYRAVILNKDEDARIVPSDFVKFLRFCSEKSVNGANKAMDKFQALGIDEYVNKALDKVGYGPISIDDKVEYARGVMSSGKEYFKRLIKDLEPIEKLDDNAYITFYDLKTQSDKLEYHKTGAYLYLGAIVDPDYTVAAGAGVVIIHSADDYIMYDTHVPYDAKPHDIYTVDETKRDEIVVVMDRADDSYVAVDPEKKEVHFVVDEEMAAILIDEFNQIFNKSISGESDVYVGTVYTKTGNFAHKITTRIMNAVRARVLAQVNARFPSGGELADKALAYAETKLLNLETRVLNKLQQLDTLDNGTRIYINGLLPIDLGTYEITRFDFNVNEINIVLDNDLLGAINAALTREGFRTINKGADGYVVTGYEKAEDVAQVITDAIINKIRTYATMAIYKIDSLTPEQFEKLTPEELKYLTADKINEETQNLLAAMNAKLLVYEARLLDKLQEIDDLDNDTRIVLCGKLPVNVGTYDFFGYDYDVSATRGVLVIEPIYIELDDGTGSKYEGENDPDPLADVTVKYYSYSGVEPNALSKVYVSLPAGYTQSMLITDPVVTRTAGEEVGKYDMAASAELIDESGNFKMATQDPNYVEDGQDFEIVPEMGEIIYKDDWRIQLDSEFYLNYYPILQGFSAGFNFKETDPAKARIGYILWTGATAPTDREQLRDGAANTKTIYGMKQNPTTGEWFFQTPGINAKNLGDRYFVRPFLIDINGEFIYEDFAAYNSVQNIAESIIRDKTRRDDDRYVSAAMLKYGASAQLEFAYKTNALVDRYVNETTMAKYNLDYSVLAFDAQYEDALNTSSHIVQLANSLNNALESKGKGVAYTKVCTMNLGAAIQLIPQFKIDASIIDMTKVKDISIYFWDEREMDDLTSLAVDNEQANEAAYVYKLAESEHALNFRALSHFIRAKYMGDTVYFTCRVVMDDGTIYNSSLGYYSPECFAGDHIRKTTDAEIVQVCKDLIVYSEMAYRRFILNQ